MLPEQKLLGVLPAAGAAAGVAGPGVLRLPADRGQLQVRAQRVARHHGVVHHVPAALPAAGGRGQIELARPAGLNSIPHFENTHLLFVLYLSAM